MNKKMPIIDLIRKKVTESNSNLLKNTKLTKNVSNRLEVDFFVDKSFKTEYKDIYVKDIVSLGRNDHWNSEFPSWIELIEKWIYGLDWRDEVIDYFENDIRDNYFPAMGAGGILEMESLGGLLTCSNGNHRLVGAVCWVVSKYGDDAILKKVKVANFHLNKTFYSLLDTLQKDDKVYLYENTYGLNQKNKYIKIINEKLNYVKYYNILHNKLVLINTLKCKYCGINFVNDFFYKRDIKMKRLEQYINIKWEELNEHYLEIMKRNNLELIQ